MRKTLCVVLLALVALAGVMATGTREEAKDDDYVVNIGYGVTGGLCAAPFYIAAEKGYYEEEKLKWEKYNVEPGTLMQLLTNGQVDAGYNLLATLIQPLGNGLDIKIPLALHTGCVKVLVPVDSDIKSVADLKGKKIGTDGLATSSTVIPQRYLAELGYKVTGDNADVEFVVYPSAELPLALEKGLVDAIGLGDPRAQIIQNEGKARVIINSATDDYLKNEFCCVTPLRTEFAQKHPDLAARFVRAIQKGAKFVQDNPDETARILSEKKYVAGDPAVNAQILKTYNYRASVSEAETALARNTKDLQRIGLVNADLDVDALTRNTFIKLAGVPDSLYK
ncbi:MAG: ABC transporter substrate-binding protein [Spirochaetia bacterium]|jgi:NitT/TauT family transport system substrate-binding protein|nr:ABC transporter substrate-binding protein [Spirochaetia bacterium]